jgi:hypothetical protein
MYVHAVKPTVTGFSANISHLTTLLPPGVYGVSQVNTREKLTGYEWVERFPEEFAQRYKKDHQRYLEYLAQSVDL